MHDLLGEPPEHYIEAMSSSNDVLLVLYVVNKEGVPSLPEKNNWNSWNIYFMNKYFFFFIH